MKTPVPSDENISIDQVSEAYYTSPTSMRTLKLSILALLVFALTFFMNFPINQRVENFVQSSILSQLECPLNYQSINTRYFPPGIELINPSIPAHCLDSHQDFSLNTLSLRLALPSFFPLGPRFFTPIQIDQSRLDIYTTLTMNSIHLNIRDAVISKDLIRLIGDQAAGFIEGQFHLNTILSIPYQTGVPSNGDILVESQNLEIPSQSFQGFLIPRLPLDDLLLKANIKDNQLNLIEFNVGSSSSPIRAQLSGPIILNNQNIEQSELNLSGNLSFSQEFIDEFSFIQLFLRGADPEDGSYSFNIRGSVSQPVPDFQ